MRSGAVGMSSSAHLVQPNIGQKALASVGHAPPALPHQDQAGTGDHQPKDVAAVARVGQTGAARGGT